MNLLPFSNLPAHAPRRFVPAQIDLGDWSQIAPLFDQLDARGPQCPSLAEFEQWILDQGELAAALDQEGSQRYIAMTCHTDSPEAEAAYLQFVEQIEPELKPRQFNLAKLFLAHPLRAQLDQRRYEVFDRDTALLVELFREENVPLQTEESRLGQQYQKLSGSLTVNFRGEEKTLVQMGRYLEEPDRALREEAWTLVAQRRLQEADKFEEQFEAMLKVREQIARNAGFPNYLAYAFRAKGRFDYAAEDCLKFHAAVDTEFMPVVRQLQAERRRQLGVAALRPWDTAGPAEPRAAAALCRSGRDGHAHATRVRQARRGTGRRLRADARSQAARPRQPQGQGARWLPVHARRGAAAVHFHELDWRPARCGDDAPRGRPRLPHARGQGRGPLRLSRRAD